ncbi:major facilitator superfamily domain-containing protein [Mycena polygramma]|nr:major facilitator superfamily domain-containing protein [Mycena polygramma]
MAVYPSIPLLTAIDIGNFPDERVAAQCQPSSAFIIQLKNIPFGIQRSALQDPVQSNGSIQTAQCPTTASEMRVRQKLSKNSDEIEQEILRRSSHVHSASSIVATAPESPYCTSRCDSHQTSSWRPPTREAKIIFQLPAPTVLPPHTNLHPGARFSATTIEWTHRGRGLEAEGLALPVPTRITVIVPGLRPKPVDTPKWTVFVTKFPTTTSSPSAPIARNARTAEPERRSSENDGLRPLPPGAARAMDPHAYWGAHAALASPASEIWPSSFHFLDTTQRGNPEEKHRDLRFWLIFVSLCVCSFLTAIEIGSITTALPTIVDELHGNGFIWVGSAFALGSTALIPFAGGAAQIFGRRPVLLGSLLLFALGSAVSGAARSMNMLIAGRTIQGLGGGGIISLTQIIVSDLVSLRERGTFNGLISISYSIGVGIGPVVGGSLASTGQWRWLFYLNLPICGLAAILVFFFLRLRTPPGTLRDKFTLIDYFGTLLLVAATTSTVIALTWGGIQFRWSSANVLVPLILGLLGIIAFFVYEGLYATHPLVPFSVLSTRTGLSGYAQTFLTSMIMMILSYYSQVYWQVCSDVSSTGSGVNGLGLSFIAAPMGLLAGIIPKDKLVPTVNADTGRSVSIGYTVIVGIGIGVLILASYFPVLAPISVTQNAQALALFVFVRNFSLVWGITVGGTILQNELQKRLPADFIAQFPGGVEIAYAVIPVIRTLDEPLRTEVRVAFAESLKVVWWTTTGVAGLGVLACLLMKHYQLHTAVDNEWGMEEIEKQKMGTNL